MNLDQVHRGIKKHKRRKRIGRGTGSGRGKTSTRGHKGQGQLAGWSQHPAFEGGQLPISRRVPKRGFNNRWALVIAAVNVSAIDAAFKAGEAVTPESIRQHGLASGRFDYLKILGNGDLTKKLKISAHRFSQTARDKIAEAGGEVIELPEAAPVVKWQKKRRSKVRRERARTPRPVAGRAPAEDHQGRRRDGIAPVGGVAFSTRAVSGYTEAG
jgi:large subunit ribosomal protein L15